MESLKAKDYMQSRPITFTADMMVQAAVEKFLNSHQLGGPVVDGQGHLIGWISEQDCIAVLLNAGQGCDAQGGVVGGSRYQHFEPSGDDDGTKAEDLSGSGGGTIARCHQSPQRHAGHSRPAHHLFCPSHPRLTLFFSLPRQASACLGYLICSHLSMLCHLTMVVLSSLRSGQSLCLPIYNATLRLAPPPLAL